MSALDGTIVATALDTIQRDLSTSVLWAGWTLTAYALGLLLMLPISGWLSERFGKRRIFLASAGAFTAASLLCGFAGNIYVLIGLRFVQALGGAGFMPSATGIIVDHFGPGRDKALGLFASIFSIGAMIGPIFGGLFVTYWTWRGIFFVNVPIGVLLVGLGLHLIPADAPFARTTRAPLDWIGMLLLGAGILSAMLALNVFSEGAPLSHLPQAISLGAIGVLCLSGFGIRTAHVTHPFIPGRLIAGPGFWASNAVNVVYGGTTIGLVALVPLYAAARYRIPALESGTLLTAQGAAVALMSVVGTAVLRRTGYRLPIFVGETVVVLGLVGLALHPRGVSPYVWLACATAAMGLGQGFQSPAGRNAGLQLAPDSAPTIAALRTMGYQLGTIVAISVTTAVVAGAADPGVAHAHAYLAWAALLVLMMPIIAKVPEHRGAW